MKKLTAFATAAIVTIGGTFAYGMSYPAVSNLVDVANAAVQVVHNQGTCSGTYIKDPILEDGEQTTILYAKHCLPKVGKFVWALQDTYVGNRDVNDASIEYEIKAVSGKSDLALLQSKKDKRKGPVASIYGGNITMGDTAYAVGYPLGTGLTVTIGHLWSIVKLPMIKDVSTSNEMQRATALISPGNSGGGLFIKTKRGFELVGVATAIMGNQFGSHIGYWTPLEEIRSFIQEVKQLGQAS